MASNKASERRRIVVLGAGASRDSSYASKSEYPSPLDADFFDLLQRRSFRPDPDLDTKSVKRDTAAIKNVLKRVKQLPDEYWRSMERAFYTIHLKAYLAKKLGHSPLRDSDEKLLADFSRSVQALLRGAHGKKVCTRHEKLIDPLGVHDCIISFNYDLV